MTYCREHTDTELVCPCCRARELGRIKSTKKTEANRRNARLGGLANSKRRKAENPRYISARTRVSRVREWLIEDGYDMLEHRAGEVRKSGRAGCLTWTPERIITTDASAIDTAPRHLITGDCI